MEPINKKPLKILVVEDDLVNKTLLKSLLTQSSLPITELFFAGSLADTLESLGNNDPDIILLDLNLPDSKGLDTLTTVAREHPQIAIVVISGGYGEEIGLSTVSIGAQDYLVKGKYDIDTLSKSINYAIERKKIERKLQLAKEKYQTIFDNSAVAITVANDQEQIISWNKFTENLLGMNKDDLFLKPVSSFYPDTEWTKIRTCNIRQKKKQQHLESRMIKKDGSIIDVEISLNILKNSKNMLIGSVAVINDITEQKQIHDILERKEKNLEAIFDAAPIEMMLVDENMIVRQANEAIKQMLQKDFKEIIGRKIGVALNCIICICNNNECDATPACQNCSITKTLKNVLASKKPIRDAEFQFTLRKSNRETTPWLSLSVEPTMIDNRTHLVVAVDDISNRKAAEQKLKETMELKSQFVSTVSHELRTPLACIKEGVTIVLDNVVGKINKEQRNFLEIANRNIERLATLVNDLLDFQKLGAGKMKFNLVEDDICLVTEEVYKTMLSVAKKKEITLILEHKNNLPKIKFDTNRIIQVLTNLISNAIKFTPEKGQITISIRQENEDMAISIRDTGMGIPKDDLPKIFERFYRVQRPGKEIQGTGLGLAIVNEIIKTHKGRIDVESHVNHGTTFTVFLPLSSQKQLSEQTNEELEKTISAQ